MDQYRYQHAFIEHINPPLGELLEALHMDKRFVRGEGTRLWDADGKEYLDFVAGFGAVPFGHNPTAIWAAIEKVKVELQPGIIQPSFLEAASELARKLVEIAPSGIRYVCFANSGAEAVEAAIKAARAASEKMGIVSTHRGFHGKTLGALSATGKARYQTAFGAPVPGFSYVPYGDIDALEAEFNASKNEIAAVILEPIQGEGGIIIPPADYLQQVRQLCDRYQIFMIIDEVQTGLGRTGYLFAVNEAGVEPDCITLAKALGGGIVPVGACLLNSRMYSEELGLNHSSTFAGNTLASRVGLASLELLLQNDKALLRNVKARSAQLHEGHLQLKARYPDVIKSVRAAGLLMGLELQVSRDTFPEGWGTYLGILGEQQNLVPLLASYLLNVHGIRTAPALNHGDVMRVEPPLTVSEEECCVYLQALDAAIAFLAHGNTAALVNHLVGEKSLSRSARPKAMQQKRIAQPSGKMGEGRFAFLVHPVDISNYPEFDESLSVYQPTQLRRLSDQFEGMLDPFVIGAVNVKTASGETAYGEFVCVPYTADQLLDMPSQKAIDLVKQSITLAKARGAEIVGLGGYTSVITRGGTRVTQMDIPVTTGNSYTVVAAMQAVELACTRLGKKLEQLTVGVVGAGGAIGSAVIGSLFHKAGRLSLIGNPNSPDKLQQRLQTVLYKCLLNLAGRTIVPTMGVASLVYEDSSFQNAKGNTEALSSLARSIITENDGRFNFRWSVDAESELSQCDVIVLATSSTDEIIHPEFARRNAVICDMSRPPNVSRRMAVERPDVLVIDGGLIEIPGRPELGWNFGLPKGVAYACMAETMMLALNKQYEHTSIGIDLPYDTQETLDELARRYGFRLTELRSFDRVLTNVDWHWLKQNQDASEATSEILFQQGPVQWARENIGSVSDQEPLNFSYYLLDRHLPERANQVAVIEGDNSYTYEALYVLVQKACYLLQEHSIGKGSLFGLISYDTIEALACILAGMRLGAVCINFNSFLKADAYQNLIVYMEPELVLYSHHFDEEIEPLKKNFSIEFQMLERWLAQSVSDMCAIPPANTRADHPALCLFSSGSTGRPKGVLHSHRDFYNTNLNYATSVLNISEDDILFSPSKMFFAYGFNSVHYALFNGARSILSPRKANPVELFGLIERYKPTVMFAVPTVYLLMLKKQSGPSDLSSLRLCVSAGEPLPENIFYDWRSRFNHEIVDGIGTTEVLSTFISNFMNDVRPGSTGKVMPGFEVKIITDDGGVAEVGEVGTLWVRGNTIAKTYWNDPEASKAAFQHGWFNTHDLFYRDGRDWFYYVGRGNDILKVGGCWVSPADIEQVISNHHKVAECAVISKTDHGKLVRPKAYIVLKENIALGDELVNELKDYAKQHLNPQQYPHFIEFVDQLPRTASGKIQRAILRQRETG